MLFHLLFVNRSFQYAFEGILFSRLLESLISFVFQNIGEKSVAKIHYPISLLSVIASRNIRLHFYFQYGFRSSRWTADLFLFDRMAFNRSGANWAIAPDITKFFGRVWHAGLLHKIQCYGIVPLRTLSMTELLIFFVSSEVPLIDINLPYGLL